MRWISILGCACALMALACGDGKDGMGGSDSGGSGSGEGGDGDCQDDAFGTVMIELQRSAAEPESPFTGTAKISVYLDYEQCLYEFYTTDHTEYQQEGVQGAASFGAWANGCLCEGSYSKPTIDCTVDDMTQTLNTQGATGVGRLKIDYAVVDDALEGTNIPFGPLPTESLAGCTPLVRLSGGSVQGYDAEDNLIWQIASFDNGTARVGQGASIQVFVERVG